MSESGETISLRCLKCDKDVSVPVKDVLFVKTRNNRSRASSTCPVCSKGLSSMIGTALYEKYANTANLSKND